MVMVLSRLTWDDDCDPGVQDRFLLPDDFLEGDSDSVRSIMTIGDIGGNGLGVVG